VRKVRQRTLSQTKDKFPDSFWGLRRTLVVGKHVVPIIIIRTGRGCCVGLTVNVFGTLWIEMSTQRYRLQIRELPCESNCHQFCSVYQEHFFFLYKVNCEFLLPKILLDDLFTYTYLNYITLWITFTILFHFWNIYKKIQWILIGQR